MIENRIVKFSYPFNFIWSDDIREKDFRNFENFGNSVNFGGKSVKIGDKLKNQIWWKINCIFIKQTSKITDL